MPDHSPLSGADNFHVKAQQYRMRAEQLSAISAQFHEDKTGVALQNLAADYLDMAQQMDALSVIEERLGPRKAKG